MVPFDELGRWRPDALLGAADRLEDGDTIPHFGHLYNVAAVVEALRHAAVQIRSARARALGTADLIVARGWGFQIAGSDVVVQETSRTVITYDDELDRVEELMSEYAGAMADALTELGVALDELYAIIDASRRDPNRRSRLGVPRRPRPPSTGRRCRDRPRDPWPRCWDR
ncbi:hypothetical protein [Nocardioides albus]|uniref:Uncharacterized protein n=1 Tax=Nocardioides albus TaxID=1841 RepID=A0A7W5FA73_9ACTN|nr:hypothetical protein [Nocardioides albus]MBB3090983.1 hypothetical protein [Nocardioides albus]GGU38776.1 hypothetical protein GCM10007979_42530 [Nocardioides albus]